MIKGLYSIFDHWHKNGTLHIYADPHFDDSELSIGIKNRPTAEEQVAMINAKVGKKDTLIILGDVGDVEYIKHLRGYKVLIMGNHDAGRTNYERKKWIQEFDVSKYTREEALREMRKIANGSNRIIIEEDSLFHPPFHCWRCEADNSLFDEVYEGPLMIAEKLILSHEPVNIPWAFNIHGHVHDPKHKTDKMHLNVCSDVINYTPVNMNQFMKSGALAHVKSIHRTCIDTATKRSKKRNR